MRNILCAICYLLFALCLPACSPRDDALDRVQEAGVLFVGLDPSWPPFEFVDPESGDIVGPWAKRVILSADDEYAYGFEHPTLHTGACERNNNYIPDSLYDIVKIYMISYPPLGAGTAEKGNAREAFIREFNKGAMLGLFYGHGNTHQLAHEVLFLSPYIGRINNSTS